jgi:hypothetical protein
MLGWYWLLFVAEVRSLFLQRASDVDPIGLSQDSLKDDHRQFFLVSRHRICPVSEAKADLRVKTYP